jgi:hypothetical protein
MFGDTYVNLFGNTRIEVLFVVVRKSSVPKCSVILKLGCAGNTRSYNCCCAIFQLSKQIGYTKVLCLDVLEVKNCLARDSSFPNLLVMLELNNSVGVPEVIICLA